ncbi:MAG: hemerythrin domain-containing protein [Saccharolobus sp.]|uniref:hemerythrin domain-containing protein n=1 Tax=Saccharolobus TaxID=2100760 RepID=UPI001F0FA0A6|nr:hemerythrin domain-containing protein [Saccharolobus shibatae]MCH4814682.1 hemerythrin domain-containing protein [Saccharolobus shibatae]
MISLVLTLDHRRLEGLVEDFLSNPSLSIYEKIWKAYTNHIYWEEEILFKKITDTSFLAIIRGLETEHGSMWILLKQTEELLKSIEIEGAKEKIREFMRVLLEHDGAEEGSIYQFLESLSDEEQAKLILEDIELAEVPRDWKCHAIT